MNFVLVTERPSHGRSTTSHRQNNEWRSEKNSWHTSISQNKCLYFIGFLYFTFELCTLKDARSVSLYPYNHSQIWQSVKYTK